MNYDPAQKQSAFDFLTNLSIYLNERLPERDKIVADLNRRSDKSDLGHLPENQLACRENLFLYHFALPLIVEYMERVMGMDRQQAVQSLRGEYFRKFPNLLSANAFRASGHPFGKRQETASATMASWKKNRTQYPLNQAYPDLCFSTPFEHKIVCDAKVFEKESVISAEKTLVDGVYEAVFYRGLPHDRPDTLKGSDWGYEFACLLACDLSQGSYLHQTWTSVSSKRLFWQDANVFVMILGRNHH